jgi:aminoglycoside phosphotransferase (APT) family kinase protein
VIPEPVLELLRSAFPGQPVGDLAPTFGGFSNLTVAATVGGARCVVKAASLAPKRADVRREAVVLGLLRGSGLPVPELLALAQDGAWTVAVTRAVPGEPGLRLYERPPADLAPVFFALGATLAPVHAWGGAGVAPGASAPVPDPWSSPNLSLASRAARTSAALERLPLEPALRAILAASLAHPAWSAAERGLVHGDAGLHNIIWDGGVAALLDWEWCGRGNPLLDLAWVAWTMRFRAVEPDAAAAFFEGYGPERARQLGFEPGAVRALALGQIAGLLARSHGRQGAWDEWLRRLRWTVDWAP